MSHSFPLFAKVKDFAAFDSQHQENHPNLFSYKIKDPNNVKTADSQDSFQKSFPQAKPKIKCQELSFQTNFMLQHIEAFEFYVENYIDQMFEGQVFGPKTFMNESIFPRKRIFIESASQSMCYLKGFEDAICLKNAEIFMEDLIKQQKLREFLQHIFSTTCDEIASELLLVALQVWQHYLKIQNEQFSDEMLVQHAKKSVETNWQMLKSNNLINYLNFERTERKPTVQKEKRDPLERKFIEFMTVTFFLVICEYCGNPYHKEKQEAQIKRHMFFRNESQTSEFDSFSDSESSEEERMFTKARKKRK